MKKFISLVATSLILLLASNTASARPIDGIINFAGFGSSTNTATEITSVSFLPGVAVFPGLPQTTGDFLTEALTLGTITNFFGFNVASSTGHVLWTFGTFSLAISNVSFNSFDSSTNTGLLGGNAIISSSLANLDATQGKWTITANGSGNGAISFSSTAVPAPAGTALLGLCLLGFAFCRRNKKA